MPVAFDPACIIHAPVALTPGPPANTLAAAAALVIAAALLMDATSAAQPPAAGPPGPTYISRIMVYDVTRKSSRLVHQGDGIWEAPNWSRDGTYLLVNSQGRLYRLAADGGSAPAAIGLDPALRANNDHDFSADGRQLAVSATAPTSRQSQVYVTNADGSGHRLVVAAAPSYFHGWSPDGAYLSFVANRDGKQYDLYRVRTSGGDEQRLTSDPAHDDGSDYSPDGRRIYFNSDRGGGGNIWRIPVDGGGPNDERAERITNDALEDWFPHPSPDGKQLLFLSFPAGTTGHGDRGLPVQLRMIDLPGDALPDVVPRVVVELIGGQGTINVNSWSPDSTKFAYVAFEAMPSRVP
jgi:TolB protein